MCGIVGFLNFEGVASFETVTSMADKIAHRGPDSHAAWSEGPIALAHRRLAIIDLSPAGAQPMVSNCERFVVVYNGEIYNYIDIRADIEADPYFSEVVGEWRGHSDTEVMLAAFGLWGVKSTLQRMVGMFAIALWDRRERALYLARDRAGEKPLYFGKSNGVLAFGSELKALREHPAMKTEIDRNALALYMRHNYIPAPYTIYRGVSKLTPGTYVRIDAGGQIREETYWSLQDNLKPEGVRRGPTAEKDAVDGLESVLSQAIRQQMVSDVPLGAFLSGGVDSSTVVALMQAQSSNSVRTFSIGFNEDSYNEAHFAKAVAKHLGTDHTELYVTPNEAMAVIPKLPAIYDEPFSDSSQIPTFLVSQLARSRVTVSLSGDAGDELFGGYSRYTMAQSMWAQIARVPGPLRAAAARLITAISPQTWTALHKMIRRGTSERAFGDRLHKGANVLGSETIDGLYRGLVSHWDDPADVVFGSREPPTYLTDRRPDISVLDPIEQMMALDFLSYLTDDILTKVDRAAMAVSLETRVPMLDHRVIEYAWSLPLSLKLRDGRGKWVLREVLDRYVPRELIERPKVGFGVPIDNWLRGPLREWASDLLDEKGSSRRASSILHQS
ncbi:asparagine synthase [Roseibium sp. TrichSKD4]|nr:asparagine synthase [Roseibium sp. TrichSKD4]